MKGKCDILYKTVKCLFVILFLIKWMIFSFFGVLSNLKEYQFVVAPSIDKTYMNVFVEAESSHFIIFLSKTIGWCVLIVVFEICLGRRHVILCEG